MIIKDNSINYNKINTLRLKGAKFLKKLFRRQKKKKIQSHDLIMPRLWWKVKLKSPTFKGLMSFYNVILLRSFIPRSNF